MTLLTVIYLIFVFIISVMVIWRIIETKNIYEKIGGALMLVLLILRLFLIK